MNECNHFEQMPIRRTTGSDSQELLQSDSLPSAYHRTERLLSADFTLQGIGRKMSKGERSRRDARRQSEFDNAGRRPSETHNGKRHSKSDFPDGMDDVFATKTGLEGLSSDGRRRESYVRKHNDKEFNLEMLDTALAGLQASANSPSDDRLSVLLIYSFSYITACVYYSSFSYLCINFIFLFCSCLFSVNKSYFCNTV